MIDNKPSLGKEEQKSTDLAETKTIGTSFLLHCPNISFIFKAEINELKSQQGEEDPFDEYDVGVFNFKDNAIEKMVLVLKMTNF